MFAHWIKIRVFNSHLKYEMKTDWIENRRGKYAVFAIYPGTTTVQSCLRILKSLTENHFTVLVVVNKNRFAREWIQILQNENCVILERPNLGRDFGAYQSGIRFLREKVNFLNVSKLVLINDTAYVSPKCQTEFLSKFFAQNEYSCLFKHYQGVVHASSNLIQIEPVHIDLESFLYFWKKYYPYNSRLKVVFRGEHELSKKIGVDYLRPASKKIELLPAELLPEERAQMYRWIYRSNPDILISQGYQGLLEKDSDKELVRFAFENSQVSNALGLFLTRKYNFPIKLDLSYYLLVSKASIIEVLRKSGCDDAEIYDVESLLESKGSINLGSPLERAFKSIGIRN